MRITFNIRELREAVKGFIKVIPRNSTLPVLQHLLVTVTGKKRIELTATDLEQELTFRCENTAVEDGDGTGSFLIPWSPFKTAVQSCNVNSELTIEASNNDHLNITTVTDGVPVARHLETMPADEFPGPRRNLATVDCDVMPVLTAMATLAPFLTPTGSEESPYSVADLPESTCEKIDSPVIVHFNAQFLIEALAVGFRCAEINDPFSPVRFTGLDNALHVLMPLRETDSQAVLACVGDEAQESQEPKHEQES